MGFVAGTLRTRLCPRPGCSVVDGAVEPLPAGADPRRATLSVVRISRDRHLVHVVVPLAGRAGRWEALLGAAPGANEIRRVYVGETGLVRGEDGLREGPMVVVSEPEPDGTRRVVIGEQREDISLCGRPTVISPQLVVPSDFATRPALMQRLSVAERSAAPTLVARRLGPEEPAAVAGLLRAVAATSAIGDPRAVTDGDPESSWSESRTGAGRGEFIMLHAPSAIPLDGLEWIVRPPTRNPAGATGPRVLWIAAERELFRVSFPEDPYTDPGARWGIDFPAPLTTDCLALVMDSAYDTSASAAVTLAEVSARTALGAETPDQLAARLRGGEASAEAAGALLRSLGTAGFAAAESAFAGLDEAGRRVALDVIDQAPCEQGAPVYVAALLGPYEAQQRRAEARLRHCGAAAGPSLVAALRGAKLTALLRIEGALVDIDPAVAVQTSLAAIEGRSARQRRALRVLLARAAAAPAARSAVLAALTDRRLDEVTALELLRALGPLLPRFQPEASQALARLTRAEASFRTRYLLAVPTAALAAEDPGARAWLSRSLASDPRLQVRARYAEVIAEPERFEAELVRALADPAVRVRLAAVETLAEGAPAAQSAAALVTLLRRDRWPMVRAAAATAIGAAAAGVEIDRALLAALRDDSPLVRRPVAAALGARGVVAAAAALRKRLSDSDEDVGVRIAAAGALAALCDAEAVEALTRLARRLADPHDQSSDRRVAPAAVEALGRMQPSDLRVRLAPLLVEGAPPPAREAAAAALTTAGRCAAPR